MLLELTCYSMAVEESRCKARMLWLPLLPVLIVSRPRLQQLAAQTLAELGPSGKKDTGQRCSWAAEGGESERGRIRGQKTI